MGGKTGTGIGVSTTSLPIKDIESILSDLIKDDYNSRKQFLRTYIFFPKDTFKELANQYNMEHQIYVEAINDVGIKLIENYNPIEPIELPVLRHRYEK